MAHHEDAAPSDIFAGIDWGGSFHQLCLIDADGKTILQKRFQHAVTGLGQLQEAISKHPGHIRIAIERSEGLLVERLQQLRIGIYCVSPKISARARERYRLATKKSDAFDAFVLADTLRHEHAHWRPLSTPSTLLARIRALSRDRERLIITHRNTENRLRAVMESYNPAVLHLFSSLDRDISLAFIEQYPAPEQVRRLTVRTMVLFCARQHYSGRTAPEILMERIRPHMLAGGSGTNEGKALTAKLFAAQLRMLNGHIGLLNQELARLLQAHPDTAVFTSFPGIGDIGAAALMAGMGEDRTRFPSAAALLAETGLAPVTRASGRTRQVRFRYAANKRMRHAIDWWAFVAVRDDPHWTGALYETARAAGQGHHRALRGIAARWVRILWRCWQDNTTYDISRHPHRREALHQTQHPNPAQSTARAIAPEASMA
jgi:transposase